MSNHLNDPPDDEGDELELRLSDEPDRHLYPVEKYLADATAQHDEVTAKNKTLPSLPMLVGVFDFPWRLTTLNCWIPMTLFMVLAGGMQAFLFTYGMQAGVIGVRAAAPPAFVATVAAFAYMAACAMKVIEDTSQGLVAIDDWPRILEWKEWSWGLVFLLVMMAEAGLVALPFTFWSAPLYWLPTILLALLVLPVVLLASLEADMWFPYSPDTFRTFQTRPLLWTIFYAEYLGLLIVTTVAMGVVALVLHWWSFLIIAPILASFCLIAARLLGRLAWCLIAK